MDGGAHGQPCQLAFVFTLRCQYIKTTTLNMSPPSAPLLPKSGNVDEESAIIGDSSPEENVPNGSINDAAELAGKGKKRKRKRAPKANNSLSTTRRRLSVSKPARDPRDEAVVSPLEPLAETRSPSPVIDFDGLSRPSMSRAYITICDRRITFCRPRNQRTT